jgi:hypothetical protein
MGWFLPNAKSKAITLKYLLVVIDGTLWLIEASQIVPFTYEAKSWSKLDIFVHLSEYHFKDKETGFEIARLPDREYLLSILHTLNEDH